MRTAAWKIIAWLIGFLAISLTFAWMLERKVIGDMVSPFGLIAWFLAGAGYFYSDFQAKQRERLLWDILKNEAPEVYQRALDERLIPDRPVFSLHRFRR